MSGRTDTRNGSVRLESVLDAIETPPMPSDARDRVRGQVLAGTDVVATVRLARAKTVFIRSAAAFTTTATLLASTGLAAAASMPGSPLYPVKRAMEEVRVAFAPEAFRVDALLEMTQERTREVRELMDAEAPDEAIQRATDGFGDAADRAVDSQADPKTAADVVREIEEAVAEEPVPVQEQVGTQVPAAPTPEPAPASGKAPTPAPAPEPEPPTVPSQGADAPAGDSSSGGSGVSQPGN